MGCVSCKCCKCGGAGDHASMGNSTGGAVAPSTVPTGGATAIGGAESGREGTPAAGASTSPESAKQDYRDRHAGVANPSVSVPQPPEAPKPGEIGGGTQAERHVIKVVNVDFLIGANARAHHTDMYELTQERVDEGVSLPPRLVVRRGEPFDVAITFDREFDEKRDDVRLVFEVGEDPRENRGTRVILILSAEDLPRQWGAKVLDSTGPVITMRVFTPPNLAVAKWSFKFDTIIRLEKEDESKVFRYAHPEPVYILFNPWCKDDAVFMSDEAGRQEYVLSHMGRVYCGTIKQIQAKPWNFGQFEDFVLDVCLYLLDQSALSWRLRGDPVHVVRKIAAMANSPDDNGVLVGNWSGEYTDGKCPTSWLGSVAILDEYWKTKQGVKYGQCWVFSAVVTTICRCLGIPAHSVTNFASAHDSDGSITIDCYWSADGKPLEEYNSDSVWNFHVWNGVWMTRPDLPPGFGGWQAIDATPQECSDGLSNLHLDSRGIYCTGPASVEAIRNGLVQLPYDGPFVFAEVNADRVHWIQKPEGGWTHTIETNCIGKNISTAGLGTLMRADITDLYKYPEGSQQERTAVWRAAKECSTRKEIYQVEIEDMEFHLTEKEDAMIGEDFDVTMKVTNKGAIKRRVSVTLTATVVNYTGVPMCTVKTQTTQINTEPNASSQATMLVKVDDYLDKLAEMCHIKISCMSNVEETKQFHCQSDDFRLLKPHITLKVPAEVRVDEEFEVEAFFTNPLPRQLTQCHFHIEAAQLQRPNTVPHGIIPKHGVAKFCAKLTPKSSGEREIIVGFDSKELWSLSGTAIVRIFETV